MARLLNLYWGWFTNVNPRLINPQTAVGKLGGVPFEYYIITLWGVPPN